MAWNYTQQQPMHMQQPMQMPQPMQMHYQQHHPQYVQQQHDNEHYGSYGQYYKKNVFEMNAWQAYQMRAEDELSSLYASFVSSSEANTIANGIQCEDLCNILNNTQSIRNYYGITWSRELCSILMAMLDRNPDGFMDWPEFLELQRCLLAWHNMFKRYDQDGSGYIEANELANVIKAFGYRTSPDVLTVLLKRYSRAHAVNHQVKTLIAFDDFVSLSVRLRAYTDAFRKRDRMCNMRETGTCTFSYDDFLRCVMCL